MGDFLGATICVVEVVLYLSLLADAKLLDDIAQGGAVAAEALHPIGWLAFVICLPQIHGMLRRWLDQQPVTKPADC